jgi:hypothetical protein
MDRGGVVAGSATRLSQFFNNYTGYREVRTWLKMQFQ